MKKKLLFLVIILLSMMGTTASAHDFEVANADGVTIYYLKESDTEVAVSCRGEYYSSYSNEYAGNVVIPESVTYNGVTYSVTVIAFTAFRYCSGLTSVTIPNSVTTIGECAFEYCRGLTSITFPNSVTSIGGFAFDGTAWYNNQPNGLVYAGKVAYKYKGEMPDNTNITIAEGTLGIAYHAFQGCNGLTSITISNGVTSIGGYAFAGCNSLTSVTIPNSVTSIGDFAFDGTAWYDNQPNGLVYAGKVAYKYKGEMPDNTKITIAEGTLGIANRAFEDCNSLTSITIPNSVTSIGDFAFYCCGGLTSVTIPNSVTSIGYDAFQGCNGLTSITISNGVTSIGEGAFWGCSGLTSVTIPNSVTSIGNYAFDSCSGLISVSIPNSVTSIGSYVFYGCSGLTSITIPNSVTNIGSYAFKGCSSLTSITFSNNLTSIGSSAFRDCSSLTSVAIPNSVTSIGYRAFMNCRGLTSITIPQSVTSIDGSTFEGCNYLTAKVSINDYSAFCNNKIVGAIGKPVILVDEKGDEINKYVIPKDVTSIGDKAFCNCSSLTSITIPNSVTRIGEGALYGCTGLESVILPEELSVIKKQTFYNCSSLKSIIIPSKVEYIYQEAFSGCYQLESVKALPENPPFLYVNSFSNYDFPLYVPEVSINKYIDADYWKEIKKIYSIETYNLTYYVDNEVYKNIELHAEMPVEPIEAPTKEGYTFSGWSEIPEKMPAKDVIVTGTFTVNQYTITYIIDNEVYTTQTVDYGSTIIPPTIPERKGYDFAWSDYPETMPAHDITVYGTYTTGIEAIMANPQKARIYDLNGVRQFESQKGINIVNGKKYVKK